MITLKDYQTRVLDSLRDFLAMLEGSALHKKSQGAGEGVNRKNG